MKKCAYLATVFGCMLLMPLAPVPAQADDVVVGVNLDNKPDQLTPQEQNVILDDMKAAGVRIIRAGIADNDKSLDFVQRVYAHGIQIEWGTFGVPSPSGNMILSSADPAKFRAYLQPLFAKLEGKGIVLAGIELGNEINLSNHDLGATGTGRVLTLEDLSSDPKGRQVAKGYLQYIKLLAVLKDVRDHSLLNRHTPIISAGLSPIEPPSTGSKNDAVSLTATLRFLRANGMDQFVDGYGVHWYPRGDVAPAAWLSDLQQHIFAECGSVASGGKPCWLTEWGLPVSSGKSCPVVDVKRTAIFSEWRNDFKQFAQQGRLKGLFLYTWKGGIIDNRDDENPYGAFICGAVTKSGRLAVEPM